MRAGSCWIGALAAIVSIPVLPAAAQQVHVTTPLIGVNDSFYEHFNVGWRMRRSGPGGSWFLGFGGPNSVIPPFGGYDPNGNLQFGFGTSNFQFNVAAGSGSNRSVTMAAPSLMMMNGARGQFFSGEIRPFVTGLIPVVGDYPVVVPYAVYPPFAASSPLVYSSPLADRVERLRAGEGQGPEPRRAAGEGGFAVGGGGADPEPAPSAAPSASSAERGDISVAEIRKLQAREDEARNRELEQLLEEARTAERDGQFGVARVRYQQAATRASGKQRREILEALARLKPLR